MNFNSAFCTPYSIKRVANRTSSLRCAVQPTSSTPANTTGQETGVNINKYKSQRSILSTDKRDLQAEEVNGLMVKAGKAVR